MEPRNGFRGIDFASLCSLAGQYIHRVVVLTRQARNRFLDSLKGLQIRAQREKCKPVLLRLSLAGNLVKTTYVPLWDRMEGAWLWTLLSHSQSHVYFFLNDWHGSLTGNSPKNIIYLVNTVFIYHSLPHP